jgi:hypothetical protein
MQLSRDGRNKSFRYTAGLDAFVGIRIVSLRGDSRRTNGGFFIGDGRVSAQLPGQRPNLGQYLFDRAQGERSF